MSRNAYILFFGLSVAILVAGLAAIYMLWEQEPEDTQPLGSVGNFATTSTHVLVPEISFEDGERHRRTLSDFRGQIVLLNFWATWCGPCIRELPSLDRLQARLKGKGVTVLALSLDRGGVDAVKRFYEANGIHNLGVYVDTTLDAQEAFSVPGLSTTVLIDAEGHDRGRLIGPADWSRPDAEQLLLGPRK